jgi:hypothetical protein
MVMSIASIGYSFSKRCFDKLELQFLLRNACTCTLNWVNISGYVHMRSFFLIKRDVINTPSSLYIFVFTLRWVSRPKHVVLSNRF